MKFPLLCALLLVLACSKGDETVRPDVARFFQVYQTFVELNQADGNLFMDKSALMDSALTLHEMSPAQFDTTLAYLERHPEIFLQAFEQFDDSLQAKLKIGLVD
ncbi:hypothetical protein JXA02_12340 [candidate division KSB1 bacterium]|nr:hypothetical protein [candidate division KSB1 bacterium]RQW01615.1 MAG: hypothetical protein EH222_14950 [candidate division KSB1 bacterium]